MAEALNAVSVRVLGSLVEKESTTPDNYPLTLNAIVTACNQTTAREPVMNLSEATVQNAIDDLTRRMLVRQVYKSESRAKRYRHTMTETLHLHPAELAVMGVLMLRGPQTAGEIRTRTGRLFEFRDVPHVDVTLQTLMTMTEPLVAQMPRRPGQKEVRYAHLLSGQPEVQEEVAGDGEASPTSSEPRARPGGNDARIEALEQTVQSLRDEMADLREQFEEFKRQFQ